MTYYSHIRAHQDGNESFDKLDQKAQLNCICNQAAKQRIVADGTDGTTQGRLFPLEPISVFVRGEKNDLGDRGTVKVLGASSAGSKISP